MTTLINSSALKPCSVSAGAMSCWTFGSNWSIFCICFWDASPGEFSMSWIVFVSESLFARNWANAASRIARRLGVHLCRRTVLEGGRWCPPRVLR